MIEFTETEASIKLSDIEVIEKLVGLELPQQYKEHLLNYNGGQCFPNVFSFREEGNLTDSCIDWFLAIYDGEYDNLKKYIEIYKSDTKRMPTQLLPIAHDPGGNLICISAGKNDYGYIYFWDHEKEVDYKDSSDENYANLYLIAHSFEEFLGGLKEDFS